MRFQYLNYFFTISSLTSSKGCFFFKKANRHPHNLNTVLSAGGEGGPCDPSRVHLFSSTPGHAWTCRCQGYRNRSLLTIKPVLSQLYHFRPFLLFQSLSLFLLFSLSCSFFSCLCCDVMWQYNTLFCFQWADLDVPIKAPIWLSPLRGGVHLAARDAQVASWQQRTKKEVCVCERESERLDYSESRDAFHI